MYVATFQQDIIITRKPSCC